MKRRGIGAGLSLAVLALSASVSMAASEAVAQAPARVVTRPDWAQIPTGEDLARYYPEKAQREGVSGKATLTCSVTAEGLLTGCAAVENKPGGYGFDTAALSLSTMFRMKPTTREGQPVDGGSITIPIVFQVPEGPSVGPSGMRFGDGTIIITKADGAKPKSPGEIRFNCPDGSGQCAAHSVRWITRPDSALSRAILQRSGQSKGLAVADCTIAADGGLEACKVLRAASPAAEAAVREALSVMRADAVTEDGLPTVGASIQIPFQWDWLTTGLKAAP